MASRRSWYAAAALGAVLMAGYGWFGSGQAQAQAEAPATGKVADLERGEVVFELCTQCHGPQAEGNPSILAPAIAGLPAWYLEEQLRKFKQGVRGRHPDDYAGLRMRPMTFVLERDEDIPAVAGYVASLPPRRPAATLQGGDASRGKDLYAVCTACHGPDGSGMEALKAPPLNHASDWYLVEQLKKFRAGIRGADPRDTNGLLMTPMATTLPDEQALLDVVAHISSLSAPAAPAQ